MYFISFGPIINKLYHTFKNISKNPIGYKLSDGLSDQLEKNVKNTVLDDSITISHFSTGGAG